MAKFVVYAHDNTDFESSLIYVCTCDTEEVARNISDAMKYRDTCGNKNITGMYDYYVKKEDWIV